MPVSGIYLSQVEKLHASLVSMGQEAGRLVGDAVAALVARDPLLAEEVIGRDDQLDSLEDEHEEWTTRMIALNQPVARDLRLLIAFLHINSAIERVGDVAVNIAQACLRLRDVPKSPYVDIPTNYELTRGMWTEAMSAFANLDEDHARRVRKNDDSCDRANKETILQLLDIGKGSPEHILYVTNMIGVSKALERIADLSVDICDEVVFARLGELRHARAQRESA